MMTEMEMDTIRLRLLSPGGRPADDAEAMQRPSSRASITVQDLETITTGNVDDAERAVAHDHLQLPQHHQQHRSLKRVIHDTVERRPGMVRFRDGFFRRGKKRIGTLESLKNIALSSSLNFFLLFIPLAWIAHFGNVKDEELVWPYPVTFTLCFLAIIPLERLFDYGGEQMAFYVGSDFGDLLSITLHNVVEATLANILLSKCYLKLLQSTIIGVVILHLLLVPGMSFIVGGARLTHQDLQPHHAELNHTLLTVGVLSLLLPAALFAALGGESTVAGSISVNDATRESFLHMSRGIAIILLTIYIGSRIYMHNPPGNDNAMNTLPDTPYGQKRKKKELEEGDPEVSQWVCIAMLVVTITLMATTAEWLVTSIEFVRKEGKIAEEWFGLVLLPIVSFSADGAVTIAYFVRYMIQHFLGRPEPPSTLARARGIDLAIQFILFWMPLVVLLGWSLGRPISLLFDMFEVAVVIASCFIVNYVTADAKTNWAEGYAMVSFYVMIALCAWFYSGQRAVEQLLVCGSVDVASEAAANGEDIGN